MRGLGVDEPEYSCDKFLAPDSESLVESLGCALPLRPSGHITGLNHALLELMHRRQLHGAQADAHGEARGVLKVMEGDTLAEMVLQGPCSIAAGECRAQGCCRCRWIARQAQGEDVVQHFNHPERPKSFLLVDFGVGENCIEGAHLGWLNCCHASDGRQA